MAVADVDGDSDLDVLITLGSTIQLTSDVVRVFIQGPPRTYSTFADYPVGPRPGSLKVGDLNADGHPDVVTLNRPAPGTPSVSVLWGDGGGFSDPLSILLPDIPELLTYESIALGDATGDGQADVLALGLDGALDLIASSGQGVTIYSGAGDGAFPIAEDYFLNGVSGDFITFADLNGDGWPEWIAGEERLDIRPNRAFPSEVLVFRSAGQRLKPMDGDYPFRELFVEHGTEFLEITAITDEDLQAWAAAREAAWNRFWELLRDWQLGRKPIVTSETVDDTITMLDEMEKLGSPEFRAALVTERAAVNDFSDFVGLPLEAVLGQLGLKEELVILGVALEGGGARLRINGSPGGRFILERTDSLRSIDWQPVGGAVKEVSAAGVFLVDPAPPPKEAFYRVREVLDQGN